MSSWTTQRSDLETVTKLLGRPPSGEFSVAVRKADGSPVVVENAPFLDDGRPMPTMFWLVDPSTREVVSRLESAGGVKAVQQVVDARELERAHALYAAERDAKIAADHVGPRPSGGVGGTRRGVKCLHAHLAWWLAGGDDPVGAWVAEQLALDASQYLRPGEHPDEHRGGVLGAR